jgi:hypothetical protein
MAYPVLACLAAGLVLASCANKKAVDSGLIGYWDFETVRDGELCDLSGNGNDGKIVGIPEAVEGVCGKGMRLIKGVCYVDFRKPLIPTKDFAVCCWLKAKDWEAQFFLGQYKYLDPSRLDLAVRNGKARIQLGSILDSKARLFIENKWYFIAYSREKDIVSIYVDGQLALQDKLSGEAIQTEPTQAGNLPVDKPTIACDVCLDELRIYSRALNEDEVKEVMSHTQTQVFPGRAAIDTRRK